MFLLQQTSRRIITHQITRSIRKPQTFLPVSHQQHHPLSTSSCLQFKNPKMSSGPPNHEMHYFPQMTGALPASSPEFRKVLFTGLYSQVVLMTIPVGGDIGDEVHTVDRKWYIQGKIS